MKHLSGSRQVMIIVTVFILSRILAGIAGLHLSAWPLYAYWQYLDLNTLKHHLLRGIWYDHAQPPVFNLLLGLILKTGGDQSTLLFAVLLRMISLANGLLIFSILRKITVAAYVPLIFCLVYLLSPATLVFECEIFYTTTISFLLLVSVYFLIKFTAIRQGMVGIRYFFPFGPALPDPQRLSYYLVICSVGFSSFLFPQKTFFSSTHTRIPSGNLTGVQLVCQKQNNLW